MSYDPDKRVTLQAWPPEPAGYPEGHGRDRSQFVSPARLCDWSVWLMVAAVVTGILYASFRSSESDPPTIADLLPLLGVTTLDIVVLTASQVYFLMWVYRVSSNLRAFGAEGISISPGWAVGYFFIPILSFYKPYHAMRDAWQASQPGLDLVARPESWWRVSSDPRVGWWWASVMLQPMVGYSCAFLAIKFGLAFPIAIWILLVARFAMYVATVVFITALTKRQDEAARRIWG
jgi:hypothetical protein